jgi:uncharacterized protein YaaQ
MKLIISVINRDDTYSLTDALVREGHTATIVSTTGGFLREGNATLLIGVEDRSVPNVLRIIRAQCSSRTKYITPIPPVVEWEEAMYTPIEVQVGGAVVFVLDVDRFEKY